MSRATETQHTQIIKYIALRIGILRVYTRRIIHRRLVPNSIMILWHDSIHQSSFRHHFNNAPSRFLCTRSTLFPFHFVSVGLWESPSYNDSNCLTYTFPSTNQWPLFRIFALTIQRQFWGFRCWYLQYSAYGGFSAYCAVFFVGFAIDQSQCLKAKSIQN